MRAKNWWPGAIALRTDISMQVEEVGENGGAVLARLGPCVLANPMTQDKSLPTASPHINQ